MSVVETLLSWYGRLNPRAIDLVGDYAGRELFMVEGDSLLRNAFSDPRIDMKNGFQLLHAVYVVECFLLNLKSRKCSFHLVFFEDNKNLCIPSHAEKGDGFKYLLARSVIIRHLRQNISIDEQKSHDAFVFKFQSMEDPDFQAYLSTTMPYFIMCSDGENVIGPNRSQVPQFFIFRAMIWTMIRAGYNIALVNQVEFRDSKVMTKIVEGNRRSIFPPGFHSQLIVSSRSARMKIDKRYNPGGSGDLDVSLASSDELHSEREVVAVSAISTLLGTSQEASVCKNASVFLLHIALLNNLSLEQRHLADVPGSVDGECLGVHQEIARISRVLLDTKLDGVDLSKKQNIHDYIDGRLLKTLYVGLDNGDIEVQSLPAPVLEGFDRMAKVVKSICDYQLSLETLPSGSPVAKGENGKSLVKCGKSKSHKLLPFSNPAFDPHFTDMSLEIDTLPLPCVNSSDRLHHENTHWHKARLINVVAKRKFEQKAPQTSGKGQPDNKWLAGRARKGEQFWVAHMAKYAASLVGANGRILEPVPITNTPKEEDSKKSQAKNKDLKESDGKPQSKGKGSKESEGKSSQSKGKGSNESETQSKGKGSKELEKSSKNKPPSKSLKPPKLSKADEIRAAVEKKNSEKAMLVVQKAWSHLSSELNKLQDEEAKITRLDQFLYSVKMDSDSERVIEVEVRLYKIWMLQRMWSVYCKENKRSDGYSAAAMLFDEARKILSSKGLTTEIFEILVNVFHGLGIPVPFKPTAPLKSRKLSFATDWRGKLPVGTELRMSFIEFQLMHCGPYMDRNMDSAPDHRVSFEPDGWQRKVLDELDDESSVFVVAPTSAGKTFIAFYAMEKVLRGGNEGVLVYVAPTKALVNQIAAEVLGRFSKTYPHAGRSVWAIHTRDYRMNNPTGCQILITVPHILQIMLLSPPNANSWAPRVKRIIFDEIHSIGQAEDGVVWEQLLLLSPCPIIALSATVGNPDEFSDWLTSTQKSLGIKLSMIQHQHRFSDLRKFVYYPPKNFELVGLTAGTRFSQLGNMDDTVQHLNPIASLIDASRGMPDDLALEARDCLQVYLAMKKFEGSNKDYLLPKKIDPEVFFSKTPVIKKVDVVRWETELKTLIRQWMQSPTSPFEKLVQELGGPILEAESKLKEQGLIKNEVESSVDLTESIVDSSESIVDSSESIDWSHEPEQNDSDEKFDEEERTEESQHEDMIHTALPLLENLHRNNALPALLFSYERRICESLCLTITTQLAKAEAKWRAKSTEWNTMVTNWKNHHRAKETRAAKKQVKQASRNTKGNDEKEEVQDESSFYDMFSPEYPSPQFSFANTSRYSKSELKKDLAYLERRTPEYLLKALERGIGVHHAGLNRKYRQTVEMLFRNGYIRVVIATGTLSMGINMPCKTVVFAGESLYLTALNFRQASGRAGRRGFDNLGNVVFHGIPAQKVLRLVSSRLPSLQGHFPISTTLVLRLFSLLTDSKDSEYANGAVNRLLSQPRLFLGGESFRAQVLHHLRFSIEYLRKQNLLGPTGEPINFAGLAGHLYYTESSSFAFHALLRSGYFYKLCANVDSKPRMTCSNLMLVLANLFGRIPCRKGGVVSCLPPMPKAAARILRKHNAETLDTFTSYVMTFSKQHCKFPDNELPLSKIVCGADPENTDSTSSKIPFNLIPPVQARSSFVALSGIGDEFTSISDLTDSVRAGIFLEKSAVPHLSEDLSTGLNGYLLDFYRHGEMVTLTRKNQIRRGDAWFALNDFSLILATIVTSLSCFILGKEVDELEIIVGAEDPDEDEEAEAIPEDEEEEAVVGGGGSDDDSDGHFSVDDNLTDCDAEEDTRWDDDEKKVLKVLKGFQVLKTKWDEVFKLQWA